MAPSYSKDLLLGCILRKKRQTKTKLLQKKHGPDLQLVNQGTGIPHQFNTCPVVFLLCNLLGACKCYTYRCRRSNPSLKCRFVFCCLLGFFGWLVLFFLFTSSHCAAVNSTWQHMAGWDNYNTGLHLVHTHSALHANVRSISWCLPAPRALGLLQLKGFLPKFCLRSNYLNLILGCAFMSQRPLSDQSY